MSEVEMMWNELLERGVQEETLRVVTDINGNNKQAMYDILYSVFGDTSFQFEEE